MSRKIHLLQVGIGGWGWSWIEILKGSLHVELDGVVDVDEKALDKAREVFGFQKNMLFKDLSVALKSCKPDGAVIVVPPEKHAEITIDALRLGLHCLVEKPISDNMNDAKRMVAVADEKNVKLMISQNYRFKRAPQTVKKIIRQNVVGTIGLVYIHFQKAPPFSGFRTKMKEPLITDMSIHHFDQIRGILGLEPVRVTAFSWNPKWSWFEGNPVAHVIFETSEGTIINYTGSWVSQGWETTWDGDWRIQGEDGEIHWTDNEVIINSRNVFKSVFLKDALEKQGSLEADLVRLDAEEREACVEEFCSAITENKQPETSGLDNLKTLAMVLGSRMSIEENRTVDIREILR